MLNMRPHPLRSAALAVAVAVAGMAGLAEQAAAAQPVCGERATMLRTLADRYEERPRAMGLSTDGSMLEVLSSPSGSWSIVLTRPDGLACLVTSGEGWENLPQVAEGPKV